MKTNPTGIRFEKEDLDFIKKREGIDTPQQVVYFLCSEYVKLYKVEKKSVFESTDIKFKAATPKSYEGALANNLATDEIAMFQQVPIDKYDVHKNKISNSENRQELINSVNSMKKEMFLNTKQKMELEAYAKQVLEDKGFIYND